jgi:hypothetical protein
MHNSGGIQALASAVAAIFAIAGFIVLVIYAYDTRTIAIATSVQAKDKVMPFLALTLVSTEQDENTTKWMVQNQGFGPAINVKHWLLDRLTPTQRPTIMQGKDALICINDGEYGRCFAESLKGNSGFRIEYESIAGEHLRSTFKIVDSQQVDVKFENLSRRK